MILPIYVYGQPVLRKEAEDITPDYPNLKELIANMFETMNRADGVGLAAPQIGLPIRVVTIDLDVMSDDLPEFKDFRRAYINPHILEVGGEEVSMEEFNVEPVELSPASATIVATVYDLTTGEVLAPQAIVETITAGTDGTIAATTKEISCPSFSNAEYLPVEAITVAIPKLAKGQFALIPVNFYAQKIVSAAKNVTVSEDPTTIETTEVKNTPVTYGPYDVDKNIDIEYAAKVGSEVVNINAINSYIETLVNSRAMSNENVIKVLKAVVGTYNTGIKTILLHYIVTCITIWHFIIIFFISCIICYTRTQ